jgi:GxxExxY protein
LHSVSRKGAKEREGARIMNENELSKIIVNLCFEIHKQYGPGLFESVYEEIFVYEWSLMAIPIVRQRGIRLLHKGVDMGIGFVPDLVVGNRVIIELKSVENLAPVHYKQLLTYLKLMDMRLGLLINFNVPLIKNGIHRIVNKL